MMPRSVGVLSVLVIFFFSRAHSYFITVDAHAEECFFDKVKSGTKMGLMFEVAEGGFLDIDVRIVGPDGKTIHQVGNMNVQMGTVLTKICRGSESPMGNTPLLLTWTEFTNIASPIRCPP